MIDYSLAKPGQSCDSYCEAQGMTCVETGAFPGGSAEDIFSELGVDCKNSDTYWTGDQPCYSPSMEKCYGMTGIPNEINCGGGGNDTVQRLCPCQ